MALSSRSTTVVVKVVSAAAMHDTVLMLMNRVFEGEPEHGMRWDIFVCLCPFNNDQRFKQAIQ